MIPLGECLLINFPVTALPTHIPEGAFLMYDPINPGGNFSLFRKVDGERVWIDSHQDRETVLAAITDGMNAPATPALERLNKPEPTDCERTLHWLTFPESDIRKLRNHAVSWLAQWSMIYSDLVKQLIAVAERPDVENERAQSILVAMVLFNQEPWLHKRMGFHALADIQAYGCRNGLHVALRRAEENERETTRKNCIHKEKPVTCPKCGTQAWKDVVARGECCALNA